MCDSSHIGRVNRLKVETGAVDAGSCFPRRKQLPFFDAHVWQSSREDTVPSLFDFFLNHSPPRFKEIAPRDLASVKISLYFLQLLTNRLGIFPETSYAHWTYWPRSRTELVIYWNFKLNSSKSLQSNGPWIQLLFLIRTALFRSFVVLLCPHIRSLLRLFIPFIRLSCVNKLLFSFPFPFFFFFFLKFSSLGRMTSDFHSFIISIDESVTLMILEDVKLAFSCRIFDKSCRTSRWRLSCWR